MRKIFGNIILFLIPTIIVLVYYIFYNVNGDQWSSQCGFHKVTGFDCPGCGGQRAFNHLLHGDFLLAMRNNVMIVVILPVVLVAYFLLGKIYLVGDKRYLKCLNFKPFHAYLFIGVLLLFFILRNIPFYPFTLLSPP